jgi:hypothetical protein
MHSLLATAVALAAFASSTAALEKPAADSMPAGYPPVLRYLVLLKQRDEAWEGARRSSEARVQAGKDPYSVLGELKADAIPFVLKYPTVAARLNPQWFAWYGVSSPALNPDSASEALAEAERGYWQVFELRQAEVEANKSSRAQVRVAEAVLIGVTAARWRADGRARRYPDAFRVLLKKRRAAADAVVDGVGVWVGVTTELLPELLSWQVWAAGVKMDTVDHPAERQLLRREALTTAIVLEQISVWEELWGYRMPVNRVRLVRAGRLQFEIANLREGGAPDPLLLRSKRKQLRDSLQSAWDQVNHLLHPAQRSEDEFRLRLELLNADLDLARDLDERLAVLDDALVEVRAVEQMASSALDTGRISYLEYSRARAHLLELELLRVAEELSLSREEFDERLRKRLPEPERRAFWEAVERAAARKR